MKKRISIVLLITLFIFLLTSCGEKIPDGISEEAYEYGLKVVETTEDFLSADITVREARDKLDVLSDSMSALDSEEFEEQILSTNVSTLHTQFVLAALHDSSQGSVPSEDIKEIQNSLNSIKEDLGVE